MNKYQLGFAAMGSLMSILFLITVNLLTSPQYLWFIYPTFILLVWLFSLIFIKTKYYLLNAIFCSFMFMVFIITLNYMHSPNHPWFLYVTLPAILWPIAVAYGKKAKTLTFAVVTSGSIILYYAVLNILLAPEYPWAIYPAFVVLWWPLVLYFTRKKDYFGLSALCSIITIIFFITVNVVSTPNTIWAIYPIFLILWWPLSMYFFYLKKQSIQTLK